MFSIKDQVARERISAQQYHQDYQDLRLNVLDGHAESLGDRLCDLEEKFQLDGVPGEIENLGKDVAQMLDRVDTLEAGSDLAQAMGMNPVTFLAMRAQVKELEEKVQANADAASLALELSGELVEQMHRQRERIQALESQTHVNIPCQGAKIPVKTILLAFIESTGTRMKYKSAGFTFEQDPQPQPDELFAAEMFGTTD
jgi:hypothetical protein